METTSLVLRISLAGLIVLAVFDASAQKTPGEVLRPDTYEGSKALQERQQRDAEAARRNAEGQARGDQNFNQDMGDARRRQQSAPQQGAQLEEARRTWLTRPPLPPERNPLLGRWTRPQTGRANSSDPFASLQALAKGGLCEVLFGGGTFEFRASTLVGFDQRTREQELDKVEYRGDAKQVVVLPKTTLRLMVFNVEGPDRINWSGQNCVLVRSGPASRSAPLASSARPQETATATASEPSRKGVDIPGAYTKRANTPASSGTTSIARASDGGAGNGGLRSTMLSLVAGVQYPSGKYFPLAGTTFYVLKESLDAALARGGVQPPPGLSPLRAWILACEANLTPTCSQGNRAFEANTVAMLRTDLQGHAELGALNPGTYYVYGGNQRYQQRNVLWNVRVDMREGANTSVKLDQANLTLVN